MLNLFAPIRTGEGRRGVGAEFKRCHVDYLLIGDDEWGAKEIREDPSSWGMTLVGWLEDMKLYRFN